MNAANSVIAKNSKQIKKVSFSSKEAGDKIKVLRAFTDQEEGYIVASEILNIQYREHAPSKDFAILYRTNAQSRSLEEALRRLNIPYRIYGGLSFYSRKEIKDLLAYFRLAVNPLDEEALRRIINYPHRGIGETTMQKITVLAGQGNLSIWDIISNHSAYQLGLGGKTISANNNFITMIQAFGAQVQTRGAFELAEYIAKASGVIKEIDEDKTIEGQARMENIEALLNAVQEFTEREPGPGEETGEIRHLDLFMQEVSLLTDQDTGDKNDTDRVSLMTIHQAKGLEFPYVFIAGLEENLFPSFMSINSRADLEEERRLFYVAITRAEKKATISYAESRYKWGQLTLSEPSRFIDEIDERYVERPARAKWNRLSEDVQPKTAKPSYPPKQVKPTQAEAPKPATPPPGNFKKVGSYQKEAQAPAAATGNDDFEKIQVGMIVEHATFGEGKVITVEGSGPNKKATVQFNGIGQKQLLLRFAKLKF